jgi:hypothetical protein
MTLTWHPDDEWDLTATTPTHELVIGNYDEIGSDWAIHDRVTGAMVAVGEADNETDAVAAAEHALALVTLTA